MTTLTRIAPYGQTNPLPVPETMHLTPEQRAEYTFILETGGESYLITETEARKASPLIEHMAVGNVYMPL